MGSRQSEGQLPRSCDKASGHRRGRPPPERFSVLTLKELEREWDTLNHVRSHVRVISRELRYSTKSSSSPIVAAATDREPHASVKLSDPYTQFKTLWYDFIEWRDSLQDDIEAQSPEMREFHKRVSRGAKAMDNLLAQILEIESRPRNKSSWNRRSGQRSTYNDLSCEELQKHLPDRYR